MKALTTLVANYIDAGTSKDVSDDVNRRIRVVNLFAFVGMFITAWLGIRAFLASEMPLAGLLLISSVLFALARLFQRLFSAKKGLFIGTALLLSCLLLLMTALVIYGGYENTGPLWLYIVPPVTMFFAGFRRGLITVLAFTSVICVLFFYPDDKLIVANYTYAFKTRLIYSFLTITFLSAFYEYSRQNTYDNSVKLGREFEKQALYDPLTKLVNRRGAYMQIERETSRMERHKASVSLILADIDRFKSINDKFGHQAGDDVLIHVADLFKARLRQEDIISRWGGEEFLFVLPNTTTAQAAHVAELLRDKIATTPIVINGNKHVVTVSFGVSELAHEHDLDSALSKADKALYRAKHAGRNQVAVY